MVVWVLKDEKIGTYNQALGVARALKVPFVEKNVKYTKFARLPNFLKFNKVGISNIAEILDDENPPTLIISAGRRLVNLACFLKKRYGAKTVHLMNFGLFKRNKFDLIITPSHDGIKNLPLNMVEVLGSPHVLSDEVLDLAKQKWQDEFKDIKKPIVSLIIGGSTKDRQFTKKMATNLCNLVLEKFKDYGVLVTTSRRTGEENEKIISEMLKPLNPYIYDFRSGKPNPYHGFLALSDALIVTGDSMSMCSEACFTGKKVFIYAPQELISKKHARFHKSLFDEKYAVDFNEKTNIKLDFETKKFNPNECIVKIIKNKNLI
ncbi:MAG: hypothetical protein BWY78_00942 [Alphaproteobacteria bacterium ADurb.Bin438]|nr:MAG: hypothetical protein BWY78_00942 [Alphaproteobacteria bacterium ADurb.Bin438]